MSNEINTGNVPVSTASSQSQRPGKPTTPKPESKSGGAGQPASAEKVSMTDDAARLQEIETLLKNMPQVNGALVARVSKLIADGNLEINLDRIAAGLLEKEANLTDPGN